MKKSLRFVIALIPILMLATGCPFGQDPVQPQTYTVITGVFAIDGGTESTPAKLAAINYADKSMTEDIFDQQNGKSLGGRVPDAISFGKHLCLCAQDAGVVYITDLTGKIEQEIVAGPSGDYKPGHIIRYKQNLYVTYSEGYLGRIDTTTYSVSLLAVGSNPQGLAVSNEKIYIACPGTDWTGTTVAVVDAPSFSLFRNLTVAANPSDVFACGQNYLHILSKGSGETEPTIGLFNTKQDELISTFPVLSPYAMAPGPYGYLFVLTREVDNNGVVRQRIVPMDGLAGQPIMEDFNQGDIALETAVGLNVDPVNGVVFVGSTRGKGAGVYEVLSVQGSLWHTFVTTGTPGKVFFSTAQVEY